MACDEVVSKVDRDSSEGSARCLSGQVNDTRRSSHENTVKGVSR